MVVPYTRFRYPPTRNYERREGKIRGGKKRRKKKRREGKRWSEEEKKEEKR